MTEDRLKDAQERLAKIEEQLEHLRIDRTLAVKEIEILTGSPASRPADRTGRILAALSELGEATPAQLLARLQLEEPDLGGAKLRATLNHLKKQGKAINPARGRWVAL